MVMADTFNPSIWGSHTFNPNTRELETGRDMAVRREEYKAGRDSKLKALSLRTCRDRIAHSV